MNKFNFLTVIIIILLVINGFLFIRIMKAPVRPQNPKDYIIKKMHFDKEQRCQYEKYIIKHRKVNSENEKSLNNLRLELYKGLRDKSQNERRTDSLIVLMAYWQKNAEKINYNHFLEIKKICKPSQQKQFEALYDEISHLFSSKERK